MQKKRPRKILLLYFYPRIDAGIGKVYKKHIEIMPQTFSWISKDFPKQKRAVEEYNEKISENAQ